VWLWLLRISWESTEAERIAARGCAMLPVE